MRWCAVRHIRREPAQTTASLLGRLGGSPAADSPAGQPEAWVEARTFRSPKHTLDCLELFCACNRTCASGRQAADFPQPVPAPRPICSPVASWTDWGGAVCIKYLCPGFNVEIRCAPSPPLGFTGPRGLSQQLVIQRRPARKKVRGAPRQDPDNWRPKRSPGRGSAS
jgi:hypothetical protein